MVNHQKNLRNTALRDMQGETTYAPYFSQTPHRLPSGESLFYTKGRLRRDD